MSALLFALMNDVGAVRGIDVHAVYWLCCCFESKCVGKG